MKEKTTPSINMIAARRAEQQKLEKRVRIALLVVVGELAITIGLLSFMTARVYSTRSAIHGLDEKLMQLQPTVDKIHYYEAEIKKLEPRLNLLADSREQTLLWYTIMHDLSRSMPESTWLSSMATVKSVVPVQSGDSSTQNSAPRMALNLRGITTSQRLVGEAMLRLNQFPEFERIDLTYTQKGACLTRDTVEFDMVALLKQEGGSTGDAN